MDEDKLIKKKQRAKRHGNVKMLADTLKEIGDLYFETGRLEDALEEYLEQLEACETLNDKLNCAVAHRMIGEVHASLGNYKDALAHQNLHLEGARDVGSLLEEQRAFATLGRTYFFIADTLPNGSSEREESLLESKKAYTKSIRLCNELEKKDISQEEMIIMRTRLLLNLGLVLEAQKDFQQAIDLMEKATALCVQHNLHTELHRINLAFGAMYERQGDYILAEKYIDTAAEIKDQPMKAEACMAKVELLLKLSKWTEARKVLVSLYLTKGLPTNMTQQVEKYLRIVVTLCRTEDDIIVETETAKKQKLYERMGDGTVALRCFEKAVEFYQKMLSCAEETKTELGAALVSLAQTLKDLGKYQEALIYARREFQLCVNPREVCRSAVFLADILVASKSSNEEIQGIYDLALKNAKMCNDISLQKSVLKEILDYAQKSEDFEQIQTVTKELDDLRTESHTSDSDEDTETPNIGSDICLDELSDIEDEMKAKDNALPTRRRPRRGLVVKRNEKGETQLHVACINGNIENVEKLLNAGHPTDVRDHCGWTPLHEAANHDHLEIARLLLKHGANINDPGGTLCGGVTPLHDAASCGNFSMMSLLIESGANLSLRTQEGDTILDCLYSWKSRARDISGKDQAEYDKMCTKLCGLVPASIKKSKTQPPRRQVTPWNKLIDEEPEDLEDLENDTRKITKISAGEDYKRTIASLKHRGGLMGSAGTRKYSTKRVTPLLDSEDALLDDWLDDDLGINMKNKSDNTSPGTAKRKSSNLSMDDEQDPKRFKNTTEVETVTSIVVTSEESCDSNTNEATEIFHPQFNAGRKKKRQASLLAIGFTRDSVSRTPSPIPTHMINNSVTKSSITDIASLHIVVDSKVFDIKIKVHEERRNTATRIIDCVKSKFYDETGCKAEFVLKTLDDYVISTDNDFNVKDLSEDARFLKCDIKAIDTPPITERFKVICATYRIAPRELTIKCLKSCENTSIFRLKSDDIQEDELTPLLKSLEYQSNLQVLYLSGGVLLGLGDPLSQCVGKLNSLQELHLQGCDIDATCLSKIEKLPLQLRVLDLSYNPLGRKSHEALSRLLADLKYLQNLNLRYCELDRFCVSHNNVNLVNLDVSWNSLGSDGVCSLLQRQILSLNISNTMYPRETYLTTNIVHNSRFSFANIECLEMSSCNVTDFDVLNILHKVSNLTRFVLSGNRDVSVVAVQKLLSHVPTVSYIDVGGCKCITEPPDSATSIDNPNTCTLIVSMVPEVCESWLTLWQGNGFLTRTQHNLSVIKSI